MGNNWFNLIGRYWRSIYQICKVAMKGILNILNSWGNALHRGIGYQRYVFFVPAGSVTIGVDGGYVAIKWPEGGTVFSDKHENYKFSTAGGRCSLYYKDVHTLSINGKRIA